jgi:hypothetical protein
VRSSGDYRSFGPYPGPSAGGFPTESFGFAPPAQQFGQQLPAAPAASSGGGAGLLSSFNFKDIKSVVDRLGGIDGIISTVGKVQKIVSNIQQMQPMIKLLMTMLPGKGKSGGADDDEAEWKRRPRRRRKRRRKGKKKARIRTSTIFVQQHFRRRRPYR